MQPHRPFNNQLPPLRQPQSSTASDYNIDTRSNTGSDTRQQPALHIATEAAAGRPSFSPTNSAFIDQQSPRFQIRGDESRPSDMYPHYSQQYPQHGLAQPQYGAIQGNQQGRVLPSGPTGMLPPVFQQNSYQMGQMPQLPGPSPYEQMQQAPTPADSHHTLSSSIPEASSFAGRRGTYKFELRVDQQPQRARMCGFGDKDRRPITPPPCVRLIVKDVSTDEEVDIDKIEGAFFVLQVDLWDADGNREVNVIRASSSAPTQSISTAVPMAYPPPAIPTYVDMGYANGYAMPQQPYMPTQYLPQANSHVMYTRNLIGSLTVNASLLKDLQGDPGYWFVLSDLSVRTEGWFRLRMTFIDVGIPGQNGGDTGLNRSRCPTLSSIFSDKFQVYSAKKFPGVIESTPLSKCFAQQGIKIPIRKDGKGDKNEDDD